MTNIFKIGSAVVAGACLYGAVAGEPSKPANPVEVAAVVADVAPGVTPEAPGVTPAEPAPFWVDYSTAYAKSAETGEPMVVVFGFEGCAPCKATKEDIQADAEAGVIYCYVDVVNEPDVAQQFGYVPGKFAVPQVEVLAYSEEGVLVRSWRHEGRPVKSLVCGTVRLIAKTGKRAASVLKKAALAPVKAVQWVREHQPVRSAIGCVACGIQERQPVRTFFRNGGIFRR